jgi:TonB family protein
VNVQKAAPAGSQTISGDTRLLTGNVAAAEDGTALPGVNVLIKGTSLGTVTDGQGNYQLSVPVEDTNLIFTFIGFETREVEVGDKSQIDVQLAGDAAQLSEVVVTGYGYSSDNTRTGAAPFRFCEPEGGRNSFKKHLSTEVKYPEEALKNKAEGKVTISFTVEPDGQLTDFEVIKGIGYGCDEELIRLIRQGPAWKPSEQNNRPIRDQVKVRFKFELPGK